MSAFLDSISGAGYDPDAYSEGIGDAGVSGYSNYTDAAQAAAMGGYGTDSGALQTLASTALGYLGRRMDIDLYTRAQQATVQPNLRTTQNGILIRQQTGGVGGVSSSQTLLNLNGILPFLLVGGVVFLMARHG